MMGETHKGSRGVLVHRSFGVLPRPIVDTSIGPKRPVVGHAGNREWIIRAICVA